MTKLAALATTAAVAAGLAAASVPAARAADTTPPRVRALASAGEAGAPVRLRTWASENSRDIQFEAWVFRGDQLVFRLRARFIRVIPVSRLLYYYVEWRQPEPTRGVYRFCIRAHDRAGNRSGVSCSTLRVS